MDKKLLVVALMATGLLSTPLWAAKKHHKRHHHSAAVEDTSSAPSAPASSSEAPDLSDGTWGLGLGYLPAPGLGIPPTPLVNIPTLSGDVWLLNGSLALEGGVGFGTFTGAPEGSAAGGGIENSASNDFGLDVGARYVILRPSRYLLFEGIGRLAYTNEYGVIPVGGTEVGYQTGTIGLYAGAGIEAFLPFLPNVSLDLDTGLNLLVASSNGIGGEPSFNQDEFWLGGGGFGLPFTFAIHSYF